MAERDGWCSVWGARGLALLALVVVLAPPAAADGPPPRIDNGPGNASPPEAVRAEAPSAAASDGALAAADPGVWATLVADARAACTAASGIWGRGAGPFAGLEGCKVEVGDDFLPEGAWLGRREARGNVSLLLASFVGGRVHGPWTAVSSSAEWHPAPYVTLSLTFEAGRPVGAYGCWTLRHEPSRPPAPSVLESGAFARDDVPRSGLLGGLWYESALLMRFLPMSANRSLRWIEGGAPAGTWQRYRFGEFGARWLIQELRFEAGSPAGTWIVQGPPRMFEEVPAVRERAEFGAAGAPGTWQRFRADGTLAAAGAIDALGRRDGTWTLHYPSGQPAARGPYIDDTLAGTWKLWKEDGSLLGEGPVADGFPKPLDEWRWGDERTTGLVDEILVDQLREDVASSRDPSGAYGNQFDAGCLPDLLKDLARASH